MAMTLLAAAVLSATTVRPPLLVLSRKDLTAEQAKTVGKLHGHSQAELVSWAEDLQWQVVPLPSATLIVDPAAVGLLQLDVRIDLLKVLTEGSNQTVSASESGALGQAVTSFFASTNPNLDIAQNDIRFNVRPCAHFLTTAGPANANLLVNPDIPEMQLKAPRDKSKQPELRESRAYRTTPNKVCETFIGTSSPPSMAVARAEAAQWIKERVQQKQGESDHLWSRVKNAWPSHFHDILQKAELGPVPLRDLTEKDRGFMEAVFVGSQLPVTENSAITGGYLGVSIEVTFVQVDGSKVGMVWIMRVQN